MIRRREIVEALELLGDAHFQFNAWSEFAGAKNAPSFNDVIADLYDTGDVRRALNLPLSESGLSPQEHRLLAQTIAAIDALLEEHPSDEPDYVLLRNPRWLEIRVLASRASKMLRANL